jgi:hypothetical protein
VTSRRNPPSVDFDRHSMKRPRGEKMTPKQSLTRKQSLIRRSLAVLSAALLTTAWAVGISIPASAAPPVKGSLEILSVTNAANPEFEGLLVQGKAFNVAVRVLDNDGQPTTVNQATTIVLEEVSGPGVLGGTTTAVIPRNGSGETISGATYSQFANGVVLRVRATSGVNLAPDEVTVDFALTAVGANANRGDELDLDDANCGVGGAPTSDEPNCGQLLTAGADGLVVMSVGSCEGIGNCREVGNTTALVVTLSADIVPLPNNPHSTMILSCDKDLCGGSGVPKIDVFYTFNNDGDLLPDPALDCPAKDVLGPGQEICVDRVQSTRSAGDLYTYILFAHDMRVSH